MKKEKRNYSEEIRTRKEAAEQGSFEALICLAGIYSDPDYSCMNYLKKEQYLTQAGKLADALAASGGASEETLASMYLELGRAHDTLYSKNRKHAQLSVDAYAKCMAHQGTLQEEDLVSFGAMYFADGEKTPFLSGHYAAYGKYDSMFLTKSPQEIAAEIRENESATEKPELSFLLCCIYESGLRGIAADDGEALRWAKIAYEKGFALKYLSDPENLPSGWENDAAIRMIREVQKRETANFSGVPKQIICSGGYSVAPAAAITEDGRLLTVGKDDETGTVFQTGNLRNVASVFMEDDFMIVVKTDGSVVYLGRSDDKGWAKDIGELETWRDIVEVSCGARHIVGRKSDGTLLAIGDNSYKQCEVSDWTDIVDIACESYATIGLKSDGRAVTTDSYPNVIQTWENISSIVNKSTDVFAVGADGRVAGTAYLYDAVREWTDLRSADGSRYFVIGLQSDGSVLAFSDQSTFQNVGNVVKKWKDIKAVGCGEHYVAGLRTDGTVVMFGEHCDGELEAEKWTDISEIFCGKNYLIGKTNAGKYIAAGKLNRKDLEAWNCNA